MKKKLFKSTLCVLSIFVLLLYGGSNFSSATSSMSYFVDTHSVEMQKTSTETNINFNKFSISRFEFLLESAKKQNVIVEEDTNVSNPANDEPITPEEIIPSEPPKENDLKNQPNKYENYIGRFKIPDIGVDVACYTGNEQYIVDREDSAAFFLGYNHQVIADHNNQGFDKIKSCVIGMLATLEINGEIRTYQCVAKMLGHNTGKKLTDDNYNPINNIYPQSLVCYTCNENWNNITMVFLELVQGNEKEESSQDNYFEIKPSPEPESETKPQPENNSSYGGCGKGSHVWSDWEIAWEVVTEEGKQYGWKKQICKICDEEEWKQI